VSDAVIWHDVECGSYDADMPLWRELAAEAGGPVLDVGAGTGRVSLELAHDGIEVVALDLDPELLAALRERAVAEDMAIETVAADARDFDLGRRFAAIIVPMQTAQLLGGPDGRARFLATAARHLEPRGLLAVALAEELIPFEAPDILLPEPDEDERDGVLYSSQPIAVRPADGGMAIVRIRTVVGPAGRHADRDVIVLDDVSPATFAAESEAAGLEPVSVRHIEPTEIYVGSEVVILRARA
jgi:SAM-dependent methyltransferase